jgi:hypothetical protein
MEAPTWLKPAIMGGIVGAIATVFVGFNQGGWVLGGSAERTAQQRSAAAVTEALVPICISQSKADPQAAAKLKQLGAIEPFYERRDFVMKSGWATVPAAEGPNSELAEACADVLSKAKPT